MKKNVVFGMIGTHLDSGLKDNRHRQWRPSVAIVKNDPPIDRMELWYQSDSRNAEQIRAALTKDIADISPETVVRFHPLNFENPWDFEEVYLKLYDFAKAYPFDLNEEDYYLHITTGTHVMQVCYFALSEANIIPCRLYQTGEDLKIVKENERLRVEWKQQLKEKKTKGNQAPPPEPELLDRSTGVVQIIDLKSERYKKIASRFHEEKAAGELVLKSGIETKNATYNSLISQIEEVAKLSSDPILLQGKTGAGKSKLGGRIYDLKKTTGNPQSMVKGQFVEVNCATIRGDTAMSTLFGHKKGSFTGANTDRKGLLKEADGGLLFLDEIGELGMDEQTMLLKAIEDKTFRPLGSEKLETSDFTLICGTNQNLRRMVNEGQFREDLLARIDLWEFELPPLKERPEDIEPNIDYELISFTSEFGKQLRFSREAREKYLKFSITAEWPSNFRDLSGSIRRMAILSQQTGIIPLSTVASEINRLDNRWGAINHASPSALDISSFVRSTEVFTNMTPLEKYEISYVIETVRRERSLKLAADKLFSGKQNTTDRLRKKLLRYDIDPGLVLRH
ncbi:MAG: transcriptional regulator [Zetaproteobacteria bacterium]|nr:transcriptional regulator [Pseudobdellovibrionaceae bacterium]